MDIPKRIQRRRMKGWRMPANTVSVTRPGRYGNPYRVGVDGDQSECVDKFRADLEHTLRFDPSLLADHLESLRGKDLACFCALDTPCHGDVWLDLANRT